MLVVSLDSIIALRSQITEGQYTNVENQLIEWASTLEIDTFDEILATDDDLADSLFVCLRELFLSNYQISDSLFYALALNKFFISSIQVRSQFSLDVIVQELGLLDKNQYSPVEIKLLLALFTFDSTVNIPWQNLFTAIADACVVAYLGLGKTLDNKQTSNILKNRRQYTESAKFAPLLNAEFIEDLIPLVSILEHCRRHNIMDVEPLTSWCVNCIKNFSHKGYQARELNYEYNKTSPKIALIATRHNIENINELLRQFVELNISVYLLITEETLVSQITINKEKIHYITASFPDAAMAIQEIETDILIYTSVTNDCFSTALIQQRLAHKQVVLDGNSSLQQISTIDILGNNESLDIIVQRVLSQMVSKPKLSICIPTYNRAELLEKSLSHLAKFEQIDLEVNVSNNASDDHTLEVIKKFENSFYKLNHITLDTTVEMVYNWNAAISMATEEYAFSVSDDDLPLESGLLEAITMLGKDTNLMAVYGGFEIFNLHDPAKRYSNPLLVKNTKYYNKSNKADLIKDRIILEVPVFRNYLYQNRQVVHENIWVLSWCFASNAIDNGSVAVTPIFLLEHYFHDACFSFNNYASSHFNFCVDSEVEIFLASLDIEQNEKRDLYADYMKRNIEFKIQRCVESKNLMQARFFIQKGQMFDKDYFRELLPLWDSKYLVAAAAESILKMIKVKNFINKIVFIENDKNKMEFLFKAFQNAPIPVVALSDSENFTQDVREYVISFDKLSNSELNLNCYSSFDEIINRLKFTDKLINIEL